MLASFARVLGVLGLVLSASAPVRAERGESDVRAQRHVLLISVDGLHASDLQQWVTDHPDATLAQLTRTGTTYAQASSATPSDSFPGLLAMLTGGTPKSTGVFYDDSFSRDMWPPGSACKGAPGAEVQYAESIDNTVNGKIPLFTSIDPAKLPLGMLNGQCVPIYPHSFLQTNTVFNVVHEAGLYTAWSDKHPSYDIVNGPSGDGVNDLFTPEIANDNDPTKRSVSDTAAYDQLKVQAILNEIGGKNADGTQSAPVPALFGMNFQAVSVGQKLIDPVKSCARNPGSACDPGYVAGGYQPGTLKFTPQLNQALGYVDGALGSMVDALRKRGLTASTTLIVSAKHGQSPIDPSKLRKIGDPVSAVLTSAGVAIAQNTTDDVAVVWLKDQQQTAAAVAALEADKAGLNTARIQYVLSGHALVERFGNPQRNARTPDLIVQPQPGTIYSTSKAKAAEHGGFAPEDTHVALLVVGGRVDDREDAGRTVGTPVQTTQIAPTILEYLGLEPQRLKSVRLEGTEALPR
jgi:hypothetical protein